MSKMQDFKVSMLQVAISRLRSREHDAEQALDATVAYFHHWADDGLRDCTEAGFAAVGLADHKERTCTHISKAEHSEMLIVLKMLRMR